MILSSSKEFERYSNQEIQERPSDNVEVPLVIYLLKIYNFKKKYFFNYPKNNS